MAASALVYSSTGIVLPFTFFKWPESAVLVTRPTCTLATSFVELFWGGRLAFAFLNFDPLSSSFFFLKSSNDSVDCFFMSPGTDKSIICKHKLKA